MQLVARMIHKGNEIKCGDFCVCFSNNILSTVKSVIHFECSVQLVARMIQPRYAIHRFPRSVHLDARKIQPRYAIHRFPRSVQLVARMIHKGNKIKCGDFCVSFFKQHIINRQERYSFRATSCTLRFTTEPRTERNKFTTEPRTERNKAW